MLEFERHLDIVFSLYGYSTYYDRRQQTKKELCRAYFNNLSQYTKCEALSECRLYEDFSKSLMCNTDLEKVSLMQQLQDSVCDYVESQVEELHDKRLGELREADRIEAGGRYVSFLGDV